MIRVPESVVLRVLSPVGSALMLLRPLTVTDSLALISRVPVAIRFPPTLVSIPASLTPSPPMVRLPDTLRVNAPEGNQTGVAEGPGSAPP